MLIVRQRGVSLIEVLIALVVFALGVVGMAGLQLRTLGMTMDSSQRTYVVSRSQDIADKIRGSGVSPGGYVGTYNVPDNAGNRNYCTDNQALTRCADAQVSEQTYDVPPAGCTVAQMASFNLYDTFCVGNGSLESQVADWQVNISCAAPGATVNVCDQVASTVTVTTTWFARSSIPDDAGAAAGGAAAPAAVAEQDSMSLSFVP